MPLPPSSHSPLSCVELARGLGLPWALWGGEWLGHERVTLCLGGELGAPERGWLAQREAPRRVSCAEGLDLATVVDALPDRLAAWRFDPLRGERLEGWASWRRSGWRWRPSLTLVFDTPEGEVSEEKLFAWLPQAPCVVTCAWDEEGERLWDHLSQLRCALEPEAPLSSHSFHALKTLSSPLERIQGERVARGAEPQEKWATRVREVAARCEAGALDKVVLAREVRWTAPQGEAWDPLLTWCACQVESKGSSCAYVLSLGPGEALVGLTPERLIEVRGGHFETHALAGTRAIKSPEELPELERDLLSARKDLREHELVVEELMSRLAPYTLSREALPRRVRRLKTLLHLETPIRGTLSPELDPFTLIEALHPTPALGGAPREKALAHLRETEPLERGGYAAPWCWLNRAGDLSAYVVIRSALMSSHEARLFVGAGIVARSNPELEWRETEDKLASVARLLRAQPRVAQPVVNFTVALALVRGLQMSGQGLAGVVISPGSRSTPLALLADALFESVVIIDERMAGFYALGWAREAGAPVALICTSGSAGAHYLPAFIEAKHAGVPLIALTADRPDHVQGLGAPQTIDQRALFGAFVKRAWPLSTPLTAADASAWSLVAQAASSLAVTHPQGPVHVNVPFEEPLWSPELEGALSELRAQARLSAQGLRSTLGAQVTHGPLVSKRSEIELPLRLLSGERGLIYCGPLTTRCAERIAPLIATLSERLSWPVWAEASSQLRGYAPLHDRLICWGERAARHEALPDPAELDSLLFIGAPPHSRAVNRWLSAWGALNRARASEDEQNIAPRALDWRRPLSEARCVVLGERPEPANPLLLPCAWCDEEPMEALTQWLSALDPHEERSLHSTSSHSARWLSEWRAQDLASDPYVGRSPIMTEGPLWGGSIGALLSRALVKWALTQETGYPPPHLHVASSTAFRDLDMTLSSEVTARVHSQRGANGIDGTLAATLGSLRATPKDAPLLLWIGDTAAHHDLASLVAWGADPTHQTREARATILLVNNGGGGIFGLLPIRGADRFEPLFTAPIQERQQISWETLASNAGFTYERHDSAGDLMEALSQALSSTGGQARQPHFIELIVEPKYDLKQRRAYWSGGAPSETTQ